MNRYRFSDKIHLHLLDEKPLSGTSTISGMMPKVLTWWASGKALELLGWTPTKSPKDERLLIAGEALTEIHEIEEPKEYLKLLDKCYRNHKDSLDKSADKGIDLHYRLEQFILSRMMVENKFDEIPQEVAQRIEPFVIWTNRNVKRFLWSEGYCYSERLWVGGICDFGAELVDGRIIAGDFKSSKEAYTNHFVQVAGYIIEIEENGLLDINGNLIMKLERPIEEIVIVPFGAEKVEPVFSSLSIGEYKKGFEACGVIYKLINLEKKSEE